MTFVAKSRSFFIFYAGTGVTTYSLHPGGFSSGLTRPMGELLETLMNFLYWPFGKDLVHAAQTTICCAVDEKLSKDTGLYYQCVQLEK